MRLLSHPFRLSTTGTVATVEQGSAQAVAEQIAMLCSTHKGERVMLPDFGLSDPAFVGIDQAEVALGVNLYGPKVRISRIKASVPKDGTVEVKIEFDNDPNTVMSGRKL